ncbi:MAG: hypothetical protein GXO77_04255 [Calditrichaeota bacterium]|nr:hypothetical protein [Calditrichota bacterium]
MNNNFTVNKKFPLKILTLLLGVFMISAGCSNSGDKDILFKGESGRWFAEIHTDKARYDPGAAVGFYLSFKKEPEQDSELLVRYRHLNKVIGSQKLGLSDEKKIKWVWNPPDADFKGYLTEVFLMKANRFSDQINIAVDVSSDWSRFPRYGFLSRFPELNQAAVDSVMRRLNRHHINGVQFYDWQFKHHKPLSEKNGKITPFWQDIAKRTIYRETLEKYLSASKRYGMKTMAYNLLYGSWEDGPQDGVPKSWRLYRDKTLKEPVKIDFDENWSSDIYWMNPANKNWQNYIFRQTARVFKALAFDGWHVDQLGDWGVMWTTEGRQIRPDTTFGRFLKAAKKYLKRPLVMNAVAQYGQKQIAQSPVEFLYSEVWDPDSTYADLLNIIRQNDRLSNHRLQTVLAAYVNQGLAEKPGMVNNAAVLLADALIFAAGGSHLELGEHLLVHPYFPNNNLKTDDKLQKDLRNYYDFLTAYQNVLRGNLKETEINVETDNGIVLSEMPERGKIWYSAKMDEERHVLQLVNFTSVSTMNWRDNKGLQTEPDLIAPLTITVEGDFKVRRVWCASADRFSGSPVPVDFQRDGNKINLQIPQLKYWTMLVLEH